MAECIRHAIYGKPKGLLAGPACQIDDACKAAHLFCYRCILICGGLAVEDLSSRRCRLDD